LDPFYIIMTKSEHTAKKINKLLETWSKDRAKLVVAIDAYAGAGKTTIADIIAKQNNDVVLINLDDFIDSWRNRKNKIVKTKNKPAVFEYGWYRYAEVEKIIKIFKSKNSKIIKTKVYNYDKNDFSLTKNFDLTKKILLIEGIFLFQSKNIISKFIDKKIYLAADFIKADKRRISREKKRWGKNYLDENQPDNLTKYFKVAYKKYIKRYKLEKLSDLVINV